MTTDEEIVARAGLSVSGPVRIPAGSLGDTEFAAGNPLTAAKQQHQFVKGYAQAHGSAAADERRVIHVARGAGTVVTWRAGPVAAAVGDSTCTVDLTKNGASVLSAVPSIDSGDAAFAKLTGTVSGASYVAGDVFEVVIDATVGTGTLPQGVWGEAVFREAAD